VTSANVQSAGQSFGWGRRARGANRDMLPAPSMTASRDKPRQSLSGEEQAILEQLLAREFPGSRELRAKLRHVSVIDRPEPYDLTALLAVDQTATEPAETVQRVASTVDVIVRSLP
jgi:hypothetical protein